MSRSITIASKYLNHKLISYVIHTEIPCNFERSKLCYLEALAMIKAMKRDIAGRKTTEFEIHHYNEDQHGAVQTYEDVFEKLSDIDILAQVNINNDLSPIFIVYPDNTSIIINPTTKGSMGEL